ncbi:hypothetical protein IB260_05785 [Pseudomonas sp. PDM23]|uniref:hypothetical protein n=1 Tax=unclassified Pseudomonas TaxID=196821 RepID=UPI00177AC910|nr:MULTISPECIES: hypothetical protein [unclassified Pseudomonas]MBD9503757.1 hypothetical protein [Pseudomonas sp. PDM17]MBD9574815.1 hypothetical protein [Pseudomonas sp. PDM23]MBD9672982.1 hypothetical protein [Pseudomonas sp. PDM21]MBD9676531.1 hypothetical protein [Pseudomonas sp. PDM18]
MGRDIHALYEARPIELSFPNNLEVSTRNLGRVARITTIQSPIADVVPLAQIETDLLEGADVPEAQPLMQTDAIRVGQRDVDRGSVESLLGEYVK